MYTKTFSVTIFRIAVIIGLFTIVGHAYALKNAIRQIDPGNKTDRVLGTRATILYTDPNLNGGGGTYNRVSVNKDPTGDIKYIEVGWVKEYGTGLSGLVVFENAGGYGFHYFPLTAATHTYEVRNLADSPFYSAYVDGIYIGTWATGFIAGDASTAGGETNWGIESMGPTTYNEIKWRKVKPNGNIGFVLWNTNVDYATDTPDYWAFVISNSSIIVGP